jgi:hypothetical protein
VRPSTKIRAVILPNKSCYTRKEWNIIERYGTPLRVQMYLHSLRYNDGKPDTIKSFRQVVRTGNADCMEGVLTAAVILEQYGYPPLVLDLQSKSYPDHVVYLYRSRRTGLWGSIGKSSHPGLCGRKAVFRNVRALVYSYFDPYIDHNCKIVAYGVGNLYDLSNYNWRFSDKNLWGLERYLNKIPHRKIRSSKQRYDYWFRRYIRFKEENPDEKPMFYKDRWKWLPGYLEMR